VSISTSPAEWGKGVRSMLRDSMDAHFWKNQLSGPTDPAQDAAWPDPPPRKGFFTDTSICIGCKACEVACKEWNQLPMDNIGMTGNSYDNTGHLGANTWRHVAFVEQSAEHIAQARVAGARLVELGMPRVRDAAVGSPDAVLPRADAGLPRATAMNSSRAVPSGLPLDGPGTRAALPSESSERDTPTNGLDPGRVALTRPGEEDASAMQWAAEQALAEGTVPDFRWLIASDVCKHCTHAGCLDVCPTGALFRTEFGTVVVQDEVCNGCGYCVAACPFGVIDKRKDPTTTGAARQVEIGIANKCTLCYDRISLDAKPACAQACPTTSIQFGDLDEMRERARERVEALHANGFTEARLYGANPNDGVGGTGSVFLLLDEPEVYGLPPDPIVTTHDLPDIFRKAGLAGLTMLAGAAVSFLGRGNS